MKMKYVLTLLVVFGLAVTAQADLRFWLNFEEGTLGEDAGVVYDQSTYGNHGQATEGWAGYGLPEYVPSQDGSKALLFGYNDDQGTAGASWNAVGVAKSASLANIGTQWSMGGWIRVDSVAGYNGTYGNYPKIISCPSYEITLHSPGDPASYFWPWDQTPAWPDPTSWDFTMANTNTYESSWMHMILSYDGTTFTQYINGAPVFTRTGFDHQFGSEYGVGVWNEDFGNGEPYWTNSPMLIGAALAGYPANTGWLIGALDDIAIWGDAYLDQCGVCALWCGQDTPLTVATVPEPVTLSLLSLGGLALLRRRK